MRILMQCAKHASPRAMHIEIMVFFCKIEVVYMQSVSYLVFDLLVMIWSTVILQMQQKRYAFLTDFMKVFDKIA